jgi:hypothetical protein
MHLKEQRGSESLLSDNSVHWVMATVLGHFTDCVILGRFLGMSERVVGNDIASSIVVSPL